MVGIVSSGIGSGLDIQGLVQQLVAAEGEATSQRLVVRETGLQAQLSAFGSLRSALDGLKTAAQGLQDAESVAARAATSADEEAVTVGVDSDAVPGTYGVEVVRTATNERLISGVFADAGNAVGTGTLTLSVGGEAFSVSIEDPDNSLASIRDAINAAADNTGVQASIINADNGAYLVLAGARTGNTESITVTTSGGDGGLAALTYDAALPGSSLTRSQQALDAQARVNGLDVFSATNTFDGVVDGLTFTALQTTGGSAVNVTVTNDTETVKAAVNTFVGAYNNFVGVTDGLAAFDADTGTAGTLQGDSTLRSAVNALRSELSVPTGTSASALDTLVEIGISLDETGRLTIDDTTLDSVLDQNFAAIETLFNADDGYAARIVAAIDTFTGDDGLIDTRTEGIDTSIESINEQNIALNERLVALEARLLRQFNGLDSLLAQLNTTSSFLATQLAAIPTPGRSNSN